MAYTTTTGTDRDQSYKSVIDAFLNWRTLTALVLLLISLAAPAIQFGSDGPRWLLWTLSLLFIALPTLPLALSIFKGSPHIVFPFSMAIGLLLLSFSSWTLAYLHLLPFTRWGLFIIFSLLMILIWGKRSNRQLAQDYILKKGNLTGGLSFAVLFVLALAAWTFVRGLMPKAEGLEKFMDYGFMMSLWRSKWLPAKDIWLAGADINYYYFGQFVYTMLSKLTDIAPKYSYNLSLASTFAYMIVLSASLGWMLFSMAVKGAIRGLSRIWRVLAAAFAAFFVGIAGNSHAFFYSNNGPGKAVLRWLDARGIDVGNFSSFFFADSTRYIGYNPEVADKTIHEFPYYSFLVADLHAHLVNTVFVLLLLGILLAYYHQKQILLLPGGTEEESSNRRHSRQITSIWRRFLTEPTIILCGLLLAVFMMCNFWDFAVYLVVILFVFFSRNLRDEQTSGGVVGFAQFIVVVITLFLPFLAVGNPLLALFSYLIAVIISYLLLSYRRNAFSRTGIQLAVIFFLAHLLSYPFNRRFEAISKTIKLTSNQSTPQQLFILWGAHIFLALICCLLVLYLNRKKNGAEPLPFLERMDGGWLLILLTVAGIGLVIAPEIIYVRDIYENNFARANTMFKFTYQAFILLGLIVGVTLPLLLKRLFSGLKPISLVLNLLLLLVIIAHYLMPAYYPFVATPGWVPNPKTSPWLGLNAVSWMNTAYETSGNINGENATYDLSVDARAIDWLNEHVTGQPTIIEAAGLSYTHLDRISAYTGLPTVIGWETHEWLWRTSKDSVNAYGQVVWPKQKDVETVYTWSDPERAIEILRENSVEYIIIGELELLRYPEINLDVLVDLGETVFHQGLMRIIKINPDTLG